MHHHTTPEERTRARRLAAQNAREAQQWARLASLAIDPEDRAFAEGQATHYWERAARWEAQAEEAHYAG